MSEQSRFSWHQREQTGMEPACRVVVRQGLETKHVLIRMGCVGRQADAHLGGGRGRALPARVRVQPLRALAPVSPAPDRLRAHAGQLPARAVRVRGLIWVVYADGKPPPCVNPGHSGPCAPARCAESQFPSQLANGAFGGEQAESDHVSDCV